MEKRSYEILKDFAETLEKSYKSMLGIAAVRSLVAENFPGKEFSINENGALVVGENVAAEMFTKFFDAFILRFVRDFGYDFNEKVLSNLYEDLKKKYKDEGDLLFLLNALPSGTFERERLFKLSRQELENRILERTKQLQEMNAGLQKIVEERTQELKDTNEKMQEALARLQSLDKVKSEFIGIAAHQLRTPLSAIKWTLRLVADGEMGPLTPAQKNFLERGYRVNEQLIALINDLLDVSRIEEGKFGYAFEEVDPVSYLNDVLEIMSHAAQERGIELILEKPEGKLGPIVIDPERMRLVFENIIENGIKYNHKGGRVALRIIQGKNKTQIDVQDTGIGIPKDQIPRLFHKFFRADNARHFETDGTGLGLYIARIVVLRHGGDIEVESEEGKGSTFRINLPRSAKDIPSDAAFKARLDELEREPIKL